MVIWWHWVTTQKPHVCNICKKEIPAKTKCWLIKEFVEFLITWKNIFTCEECECTIPTALRDLRPEKSQLSLL